MTCGAIHECNSDNSHHTSKQMTPSMKLKIPIQIPENKTRQRYRIPRPVYPALISKLTNSLHLNLNHSRTRWTCLIPATINSPRPMTARLMLSFLLFHILLSHCDVLKFARGAEETVCWFGHVCWYVGCWHQGGCRWKIVGVSGSIRILLLWEKGCVEIW